MNKLWTRRGFVTALGCSAAASPLLTPVSFASGAWENRLVVIILRGAMDGLDALRPYGDRDFAKVRGRAPQAVPSEETELDGFFAMNPGMGVLRPLWQAGELGFAHAVSTPYRDKRSHFDGQDLLEAGGASLNGARRDGWLNRMIQTNAAVDGQTVYAVGRGDMLLVKGAAPVANWSPDADLEEQSAAAMDLAEIVMQDDPLFEAAFAEARLLSDASDAVGGGVDAGGGNMMAQMSERARKGGGHLEVARFAGSRLRGSSRIAAFSIGGWDTHAQQARAIARPMTQLSESILALREEMGEAAWGKTAVVAVTEFGRTVHVNGNGGTDHGTGGAMLLAGGALRGGRVWTDWPGLSQGDLYQGRDLMPTRDVRAYCGWLMRGLFGLDKSVIEQSIFPGLDMGPDPKLLS